MSHLHVNVVEVIWRCVRRGGADLEGFIDHEARQSGTAVREDLRRFPVAGRVIFTSVDVASLAA
jgi:hypothetical protein